MTPHVVTEILTS